MPGKFRTLPQGQLVQSLPFDELIHDCHEWTVNIKSQFKVLASMGCRVVGARRDFFFHRGVSRVSDAAGVRGIFATGISSGLLVENNG